MAGFGRLILALACGSVTNASMEFMAPHYSADLVRITQALLASSPDKTEGVGISSIRQLYAVLAERMFGEVKEFFPSIFKNLYLVSFVHLKRRNGAHCK